MLGYIKKNNFIFLNILILNLILITSLIYLL